MDTVINFKTSAKVKKEAQKVAREMGLSLSSVLNAMLQQYIRHKTLYLSTQKEVPSDEAIRAIKEAEKEYAQGNTISFDNARAAIEYLDQFKK